jgi:hypothetical protein
LGSTFTGSSPLGWGILAVAIVPSLDFVRWAQV